MIIIFHFLFQAFNLKTQIILTIYTNHPINKADSSLQNQKLHKFIRRPPLKKSIIKDN